MNAALQEALCWRGRCGLRACGTRVERRQCLRAPHHVTDAVAAVTRQAGLAGRDRGRRGGGSTPLRAAQPAATQQCAMHARAAAAPRPGTHPHNLTRACAVWARRRAAHTPPPQDLCVTTKGKKQHGKVLLDKVSGIVEGGLCAVMVGGVARATQRVHTWHAGCVVCGVWCVVCGVWCVVCGVWCVVCHWRTQNVYVCLGLSARVCLSVCLSPLVCVCRCAASLLLRARARRGRARARCSTRSRCAWTLAWR
jgi:hypothetical protein